MKDCPGCGYDLEGLPPVHVCPECGRPYDRDTYVLEAATRSTKVDTYLHIVSILVLVVLGSWSQRFSSTLAVVFLPGLVVNVWRLRSCRVLLVTPSDLCILRSGVEEHRLSFEDVSNVKYSWVTGRTIAYKSDGSKAFSIPIRHILSARRARQLVAIIKRRVADRANDSASIAEGPGSATEANTS